MQANETHKYISRGSARDAAIEAGLTPGEDVHLCRLSVSGAMRWGWVSSELAYADEAEKSAEAEFGPMETDDQSADAIMARNAARTIEAEADNEPDPVAAEAPVITHYVCPDCDETWEYEASDTEQRDDCPNCGTEDVAPDGARHSGAEVEDARLYVRIGPYARTDEARAVAKALVKRLKTDAEIVTSEGETVLSVCAKKLKPEKPARPAPMGLQVDEYDRPVRPEITQEKWVKTCAGHFDRIEAIAGNATKLLDYEDLINPGDTYRTIVWRYAKNHRLYATKYGRSPFAPEATSEGWDGTAANDIDRMSAAAD